MGRVTTVLLALIGAGCQSTPQDTMRPEPSPFVQLTPSGEKIPLDQALVGRQVKVFLRRDALGMSAPGFMSPTEQSAGGKQLFTEGRVEAIDPEWLVLGQGTRQKTQYWIPRSMIMLISVSS